MAQERERERSRIEQQRLLAGADIYRCSRPMTIEVSHVIREDVETAAGVTGKSPGVTLDRAVTKMLNHLESSRWCRRCLQDSGDCSCDRPMWEPKPQNGSGM